MSILPTPYSAAIQSHSGDGLYSREPLSGSKARIVTIMGDEHSAYPVHESISEAISCRGPSTNASEVMEIDRSHFSSVMTAQKAIEAPDGRSPTRIIRDAFESIYNRVPADLEDSVKTSLTSGSPVADADDSMYDYQGNLRLEAINGSATRSSFVNLAELKKRNSTESLSEQYDSADDWSLKDLLGSERSRDSSEEVDAAEAQSKTDTAEDKVNARLDYSVYPEVKDDVQRERFKTQCGGELFACKCPGSEQPSTQEQLAADTERNWPEEKHIELFKALLTLAGFKQSPWEIFKRDNRKTEAITFIKSIRYDSESGIPEPLASHLSTKVFARRLITHFMRGMCEHIFRVHKAKGCRYLPRLEPERGIPPQYAFREKDMPQLYDAIERIDEQDWREGPRPPTLKEVADDEVLEPTRHSLRGQARPRSGGPRGY